MMRGLGPAPSQYAARVFPNLCLPEDRGERPFRFDSARFGHAIISIALSHHGQMRSGPETVAEAYPIEEDIDRAASQVRASACAGSRVAR